MTFKEFFNEECVPVINGVGSVKNNPIVEYDGAEIYGWAAYGDAHDRLVFDHKKFVLSDNTYTGEANICYFSEPQTGV